MMKTLKTVLLISVALNIFLGGLLLGGKISLLQSTSESPVTKVLTAEKQLTYQAEMDKARQRFHAGRKKYDELHAALMTQLAAESFDRAAFDSVATAMLAERTTPLAEFLKTIATLAVDMNPAERKAISTDIRLRYRAYRTQKTCLDASSQKAQDE